MEAVSRGGAITVNDKAKRPYPPSLTYTYKFFITCDFIEGIPAADFETTQVKFFSLEQLQELSLSEERNTLADIEMLFEDHFSKRTKQINCD